MTTQRRVDLTHTPDNVKLQYCPHAYPKGDLVCHKPRGHDGPHAVLLGIHPEHEDGYGQLWPAQEEWDYWDA